MSRPLDAIDGLLIVDKPAGPTSHDVVAIVKKRLRAKKAGHTGTLDPFATGVLPVCLGRATKLAQWLTGEDKAYRATGIFGVETDTQDGTGTVVDRHGAEGLDAQRVRDACEAFRGEIVQIPPMHSAVKVDGRRLYEIARKGEEVERKGRHVRVDELELVEFGEPTLDGTLEAVVARGEFRVKCSKGTYIRTLIADIGSAVATGAFVAALRRTASGALTEDDAVPLAEIEANPDGARALVIDLDRIPLPMPSVGLDETSARKVGHGVAPPLDLAPGFVALRDPHGHLLAIAEITAPNHTRITRGI